MNYFMHVKYTTLFVSGIITPGNLYLGQTILSSGVPVISVGEIPFAVSTAKNDFRVGVQQQQRAEVRQRSLEL